MSDEDEDYNSSDDSEEESTKTPVTSNNSNNKTAAKPAATGLLSLVDNDNDYDASMFTRPDLLNFDDECGESEDELSGESEGESEFGNNKKRTKKKVQTSKSNNRQSKFSYNSDQDETKKNNNAKKKKKKQIGICVEATKYDCVRRVGRKLGFKEVPEADDWSVFWTDLSVSIDRVNQMKRWQVIHINLFKFDK